MTKEEFLLLLLEKTALLREQLSFTTEDTRMLLMISCSVAFFAIFLVKIAISTSKVEDDYYEESDLNSGSGQVSALRFELKQILKSNQGDLAFLKQELQELRALLGELTYTNSQKTQNNTRPRYATKDLLDF